MKLQILRILDPEFQAALRKFGESPNMPIKERYWLAKSLSAIESELKDVEQVRVGLIKGNGKEGEGGQWTIADDAAAMQTFQTEMTRLLETEIEVPLPTGLKLNDSCPLTASQLSKVLDLVADPGLPEAPCSPPREHA